ncbi:Uncharacterised protein [Mycobacterium tuberculosis]|uniref:Uncharacterized protein n=1 Tax=Mycobacterium tuberculosis TaxID=1773 RepID=A0A916LF27_MYCTX|nr:Uncharacterised protein [Mycobacterium tuberculosis]
MPPHPADADQPGQAADLADGGQRMQLVGRREGGPLHPRNGEQGHHRDTDGHYHRRCQLAKSDQHLPGASRRKSPHFVPELGAFASARHTQMGSLRKMLRGM